MRALDLRPLAGNRERVDDGHTCNGSDQTRL
jgi:hypothetical protein